MSRKKKIIIVAITILVIIIISFIVPVKREMNYQYGNDNYNISNPSSMDYTIYTYKNIYGITIKREYRLGIEIIN